jgi:hypothetical protein
MAGARVRVIAALVAVCALWAVTAPAAHAASSLVGQWHLDEVDSAGGSPATTPDSSPSNVPLQINGPTQVPGRFGNAFSFIGSNGDALSAVDPALNSPQVTVMAWVKAPSSPGSYDDVLSQNGNPACSVASYALYDGSSGGLQFYIANGTNSAIVSAAEPPASIWNGQWHAVAGVYDGSSVRLYVDGAEVGGPTDATGSTIDYSLPDDTFEVGNFHACSGFAYTGAIDEVSVYDRALSPAEIAQLQSGSASSPPALPTDTSTSVNCVPGTAVVGQSVTCTVMVSNTVQTSGPSPGGQVSFMSDSPGTFSNPGATCSLGSGPNATSLCAVTYTPTATGSGVHTITAGYTSDGSDGPSQGTASVAVAGGAGGTPSPTPTVPPTILTPLRASFTGPSSTTVAKPITLNAGATTGATNLLWSVNGKNVAMCSAQTPLVALDLTKSSSVTLTALGAGGSSIKSLFVHASNTTGLPGGLSGLPFVNTAVCSGGSPTADTTAGGGPGAGCTTELEVDLIDATGCLTEITDPNQVPGGEAPILQGMLDEYRGNALLREFGGFQCANIASCTTGGGAQPGHLNATALAVKTEGVFISHSTVRINGLDFTPVGGAAIVISPGFHHIVSADAIVKVGNVPIEDGQINLDVSTNCDSGCGNGSVQITSFDSKDLPFAGDFPFTGNADISFVKQGTDRYSDIHGYVQLTDLLGGATVDGHLRTDNANGLKLESFKGVVPRLGWDDIGLTDGEFDFVAPGDWLFYGKLGIGDYTINLKPDTDHPDNGIVFHNNALDHAGATFDFSNSPPEIFPGVDLDSFDLSFALDPTVLRGAVTLDAVDVAQVTGNLVLAFPSQNAPFTARATDLPGAPAAVANQSYEHGPVFGIGGTVKLHVPDLGDLPVGNGYFLYDFPNYVAAGVEVDYGFDKLVTIGGRLDGQINVQNRRFNLSGNVHGCIADIACAQVDAALSSAGIGICAGDFGGGFKWDDFPKPHLYAKVLFIGTACNINDFEEDHVFTPGRRALARGEARTIVVKAGQPLPEIRLDGDSGAPNVVVTGPGGQSLTGLTAGIHHAGNLIVIQSEEEKETVIGVKRNMPGTYRITMLPGPAITQSWHTTVLPPVTVKGSVVGTGTRRVLHYAVSRESNMQVTFSELIHGVARVIGTRAGGAGTLSFTTLPGSDRRTIVASVTRNGIDIADAQHLVVARFTGPRYVTPGRVVHLVAHFRHGSLSASWGAAPHAARYLVTLKERHGAVMKLGTRGRSLSFKAADPTLAGTVSVLAVSADGSRGAGASVSYRALRKATNRFLPFSELTAKPARTAGAKKRA